MEPSETYKRLIHILLAAFPESVDPDYFDLCGCSRDDAFISNGSYQTFRSLNAFLRLAEEHGLVTLDRFTEGDRNFFWNVRATLKGYKNMKILALRQPEVVDAKDFAAFAMQPSE